MTKITGNEPFMPIKEHLQSDAPGLTILQYYAGEAMKALLGNSVYCTYLSRNVPLDEGADYLSESAIEQAQSLIKCLNKVK